MFLLAIFCSILEISCVWKMQAFEQVVTILRQLMVQIVGIVGGQPQLTGMCSAWAQENDSAKKLAGPSCERGYPCGPSNPR
jgi:hypothetical protein